MNTYQAVLLILASNLVPFCAGVATTYIWLKYAKKWGKQ